MEAGKKNRLIRLERAVETRVAGSRVVEREWVLVEALWAFVSEVGQTTDGEGVAADQPAALQERFFTVGFVRDLGPQEELRIVFRGQAFDLLGVAPADQSTNESDLRIHARARAEVAA